MSNFITDADFLPFIKEQNLTRLIEGDTLTLDDAVATATATVRDSLSSYYDVDAIFGSTGDARPKQVVRWVVVLALYYLYERLPAAMMPQRARDNYQEVGAWLKDIEDGKKPVELPLKAKPDGSGKPVTKFRFGSALPKRTHEL